MIKRHKLVIVKLNRDAKVGDICNHMEEEYELCLKDTDDPTYNQESVWDNRPTGKFKPSSYVIANNTYLSNAKYNKWDLSCYQLLLLSDDTINSGDYCFDYITDDNGNLIWSVYTKIKGSQYMDTSTEKKIIASYPKHNKFHGYEEVSGMPIYEIIPTFSNEFLKTWVENPVDEINVEYRFLRHNREEGHVTELLRSLHDELTCTIPEKERGIIITNVDDFIKTAATEYVLSHEHWSPLMRKFYIKICSEFAKSDKVKGYYQNSNKI